MKKIAFILLAFVASCTQPEAPSFIKMQNVKVDDVRNSQVYLSGEAVFHNPNPIAGKLVDTDLHLTVNEVDMGKVQQDTSINIAGNSEFIVPVKVDFPLKKVMSNKKGLLKGVLNALLDKKVDAKYSGTITLNFLKVNFDVPVDYEVEVALKN